MESENEVKSQDKKQFKMLLRSVFAGSKGCKNRTKIISKLSSSPQNTNQLSELLGLDYKVVERHLDVLEKNNLVSKVGIRYSVTYFLSPLLESHLNMFDELAVNSKNCNDNSQIDLN